MARYALRGSLTVEMQATAVTVAASISGTDLIGTSNSEAMADLSGWELQGGTIPTPDLTSFQTGKIPGEVTIPDGTMDFYVDDSTTTIFDALETIYLSGDTNYIYFGPKNATVGSWLTADVADRYPVTVTSLNRMYSSGNEAHKFRAVFALGVPTLNISLT
jgi:hypothetical protein